MKKLQNPKSKTERFTEMDNKSFGELPETETTVAPFEVFPVGGKTTEYFYNLCINYKRNSLSSNGIVIVDENITRQRIYMDLLKSLLKKVKLEYKDNNYGVTFFYLEKNKL